jgi:hypothetical protein
MNRCSAPARCNLATEREPLAERLRNDILIAVGALSATGNPMLERLGQSLYDARALVDAGTELLDAVEALYPEAVERLSVGTPDVVRLGRAVRAYRAVALEDEGAARGKV